MESIGLRRRKCSQFPTSKSHEAKDLQEGISDQGDFESIVRAEIVTAIEESLVRNRSLIQGRSDLLKLLEDESRKMVDSVEAAQARDIFSRKYNKRMETRERVFRLTGMLCLMCPVLISFHAVMSLLPGNHVELLEYASQEDNLYGLASRFCLKTVNVAERVSHTNTRNGFIFLWGCLGALALLLLFLRHTTMKHVTMSTAKQAQMQIMKRLIQEELEKKRALI